VGVAVSRGVGVGLGEGGEGVRVGMGVALGGGGVAVGEGRRSVAGTVGGAVGRNSRPLPQRSTATIKAVTRIGGIVQNTRCLFLRAIVKIS